MPSRNKALKDFSVVSAGTQDIIESPIIPNNETWVIRVFGAADINLGDNKSSVYVLRFGNSITRVLSLTGDTKELNLQLEIVGNGVEKLNIIRMNKSGFDKEMPTWVEAYKRV